MNILALDISSTRIGFSLWYDDGYNYALLGAHYYKPKGDGLAKLSSAVNAIKALIIVLKIDQVIIEDYCLGFSKGASSASTIIKLAQWNEAIALASYEVLSVEPIRMPISKIRAALKTHLALSAQPTKEDILQWLASNSQRVTFPTSNRSASGWATGALDMSDAIALGFANGLVQGRTIII